MATQQLIDNLNRALSLELAGTIQNMQHSFLVAGTDRQLFCEYFRDQSEEAQEHAARVGDKIVALGGVPTVEPALIRQSVELKEMLGQALELEREAMAAYMAAWESCGDEQRATKFQLEGWIGDEQEHIEELEKLTRERTANVAKERIVLREVS